MAGPKNDCPLRKSRIGPKRSAVSGSSSETVAGRYTTGDSIRVLIWRKIVARRKSGSRGPFRIFKKTSTISLTIKSPKTKTSRVLQPKLSHKPKARVSETAENAPKRSTASRAPRAPRRPGKENHVSFNYKTSSSKFVGAKGKMNKPRDEEDMSEPKVRRNQDRKVRRTNRVAERERKDEAERMRMRGDLTRRTPSPTVTRPYYLLRKQETVYMHATTHNEYVFD